MEKIKVKSADFKNVAKRAEDSALFWTMTSGAIPEDNWTTNFDE